jgi:hypothetical protein
MYSRHYENNPKDLDSEKPEDSKWDETNSILNEKEDPE